MKRKMPAGLFERGGVLYMRKRWKGRLYRKMCPYQGRAAFTSRGGVKSEVLEVLDVWRSDIRLGKSGAGGPADPAGAGAAVPTVLAFTAAYAEISKIRCAAAGSPRPATVKANVTRFLAIVRETTLLTFSPIDMLTAERVRAWMARRMAGVAGLDPDQQARMRYSLWRAVSIARSLWAPWTLDLYASAGILVPDCLMAWPRPPRGVAAAPRMQIPPDDLMTATVTAYDALEAGNPRLWLAATLVLVFGMRPRVDGARATWDWLKQRDGRWWMEYTPSKTRGRTTEGDAVVSVQIPAGLYDRMRTAWKAAWEQQPEMLPPNDYIVPAYTDGQRHEVFSRELCAWQRSNGWDARKYKKPAYMLRKLCACAIARATNGDVQAAAAVLGISVTTLLHHYAAYFRRQMAPVDVSGVIRTAAAGGSEKARDQ